MTQAAHTADEQQKETVHVEVEYLPSPKPYQHNYPAATPLGTVRSDSMAFFGVSDHRDRDVHEFFLVYGGSRITNLSQTLEQLTGDKHEAKFDLVEQITPGSR